MVSAEGTIESDANDLSLVLLSVHSGVARTKEKPWTPGSAVN